LEVFFKKITTTPKHFELDSNGLIFAGEYHAVEAKIVKIEGKIHGLIELECDRCAASYVENLDLDVEIFASDGLYEKKEIFDIIEFLDEKIDFDFVRDTEIEAIRLDYHLCASCAKVEDYEIEI
jgi:hypothetical protein